MQKDKDWAIITVKVNRQIKERLDKLKIIPEEHTKNVIKRLLDFWDEHHKQK